MPTLRNITIALQSQYDALLIPERLPGEVNVPEDLGDHQDAVTVEIPVYPSSQFWISYCCPPPTPVGSFRFWYFKLSANGTHVASWGCGEKDHWYGKTVFALGQSGTDFQGRNVVEKRGFFFPGVDHATGGGTFEIKVYRSLGRRRMMVEEKSYASGLLRDKCGLQTASMGRLKKGEPRQHFQYTLLDAVAEPYATFRFQFEQTHSETLALSSSISIGHDIAEPNQVGVPCTGSDRAGATFGSSRLQSFPTTGSLLLLPRQSSVPSVSPCKTSSPNVLDKSTGGEVHRKSVLHVLADRGTVPLTEKLISRKPPAQSLNHEVSFSPTESTTPTRKSGTGSIDLLRGVIHNALKRRNGDDAAMSG